MVSEVCKCYMKTTCTIKRMSDICFFNRKPSVYSVKSLYTESNKSQKEGVNMPWWLSSEKAELITLVTDV